MRSQVALIACVALGVLAVILLTRDRDGGDPSPADIIEEAQRESRARGGRGDVPRDPANVIVTEPFTAGADQLRTLPPGADGVTIKVVEKAGGRPAAGVIVGFLGLSGLGPAEAYGKRDFFDLDTLIQEHGTKHRTDARGITRVPRPKAAGSALVRTRRLSGLARIEPDDDEATITLVPHQRVTFEVVDTDGRPVPGVNVAILTSPSENFEETAFTAWSARSDARGRASMDNLETMLRAMHGADMENLRDQHFAAALRIPTARLVHVPLDLDDLPRKPVRLTVPKHGGLTVEIRGPDGDLFRKPASVTVGFRKDPDGLNLSGLIQLLLQPRTVRVLTSDGSVQIPFVGLRAPLTVSVEDVAGTLAVNQAKATGPEEPGDKVTVSLMLTRVLPTLTGRVLDTSGKPAAERRFRVAGFPFSSDPNRLFLETDAAGRFTYTVHMGVTRGSRFILSTALRSAGWAGDHQEASVVVDELKGPTRDLGDLRLSEVPIMASGTVVDDTGAPVAGAFVNPSPVRLDSSPTGMTTHGLTARTDDEGRFTLRGPRIHSRFHLSASHALHASPTEPDRATYSHGQTDIVLKVVRTAIVAGNFLLDEGIPGSAINVRCAGRAFAPTDGGAFAMHGLTRELVDLKIYVGVDLVKTIPGVRPERGRTSRPGSLKDIDLRGRVHRFGFRVVDAEGHPIKSAAIYVLRNGGRRSRLIGTRGSRTKAGGVFETYAASTQMEIRVSRHGYWPDEVSVTAGKSTITLQKRD